MDKRTIAQPNCDFEATDTLIEQYIRERLCINYPPCQTERVSVFMHTEIIRQMDLYIEQNPGMTRASLIGGLLAIQLNIKKV